SVELKEDFGHIVRRIMYSNSGKFYNDPTAPPESKLVEARNVMPVINADWSYYQQEAEKAAKLGNRGQSEVMWQAALTIAEGFSNRDPRLAYTLENIASLHFAAGRYQRAEMFCKRALSVTTAIYGNMHVKTANCMNNLAGVFYFQQRYFDAESICVQ